jgi:hypothetical protein
MWFSVQRDFHPLHLAAEFASRDAYPDCSSRALHHVIIPGAADPWNEGMENYKIWK